MHVCEENCPRLMGHSALFILHYGWGGGGEGGKAGVRRGKPIFFFFFFFGSTQ